MSEEVKAPAPAPQVILVQSPTTPAPAPAAPAPAEEDKGKDWQKMSAKQFERRLEEERDRGQRQLLKSLGIEKADRETAIQQIKEGQLALTKREQVEAEAKAQAEALKAKAERADKFEPVFKSYVDDMFAKVPEPVQKYIAASLSDPNDIMARYDAIQKAKTAGLFGAEPKGTTTQTTAREAKPATTVAAEPPMGQRTAGSMNVYEQWVALKESGQTVLAANFYNMNLAKIESLRPESK